MIYFDILEHGRAISVAAGTFYNPECDHCIAREEDDRLLGGVTFQDYNRASIGMHTAGFAPRWLDRNMLWAAFDYPFNQLGCQRVFTQIPETNIKSLEFAQHLGLKIITKVEGVFLDGGIWVLCMEKVDCRWLNIKPRGLRSNSPKEGTNE